MEDLYDDLDNYEDVNALEELRAENKELKVKLEEHSAAMEKLQKEILQDYDTLETAFKHLENNYSSLLMTARLELQRKTQRITQLNTEKDMMVLDALKSGKRIRRNFNRGVNFPARVNQDKPWEGINKNKDDNLKQKNFDIKQERHENVMPARDTDPNSGTYNSSKSSEAAGVMYELSDNRESNVNDNVAQKKTELNEPAKTSANSIKNRRKSVPAVSSPIDTFSSCDDLDGNYYPAKETRSDNERRNINKLPIEKHKKTSETPIVDNKGHKHYESSSRDFNKNQSSRHDNSSHRGRDKYEVSLKYRKLHSPERGQKRSHREYQDEYPIQQREYPDTYLRQHREQLVSYPRSLREHPNDYPKQHRVPDDYMKQQRRHPDDYPKKYRELPDDYSRNEHERFQGRSLWSPPPQSYTRRQRTKSVHQADHDRYQDQSQKSRHYQDDNYSAKYRSKDYDEPHNKRRRIESYGNPDAHYMDDNRHYRVKDSVDAQSIPEFSPHEYDMLRFSCQSPDSVHTEGSIAKPIKEIKATAVSPLDDPRVTSKRYVIRQENGIETLSTAVGRNIDIISVNKAKWNLDSPVTPVRRPSQCSDRLVNDNYMDMDNPVTNLDIFIDSGEINETDDGAHVIPKRKLKEMQHKNEDLKTSKKATEDISKESAITKTVSKINISKYRMNKSTQSRKDIPIIDVAESVPLDKKSAAADSVPVESQIQKREHNNKCEGSSNKNNSKESNIKSKSRELDEHQSTLKKMAIVADDLELSDDNSDLMDINKKVIPEKVQKLCEIHLNLNEGRSKDPTNNDMIVNKSIVNTQYTENKDTVNNDCKQNVAEEKPKDTDSSKKQKSKKKKSKEISKDSKKITSDPIYITEKKPKSKKEKEITSKETKEKFSDLFGDSSSLMTPEDLGLPSYLPISEDAQDAVDMKINQMIDTAPLVNNDKIPDIVSQKRVEVTIQEITAHDVIPNAESQKSSTDVKDKEMCQEIKEKECNEREEEIMDTNQLPSPIVYENLNPGTDLNDANVVKTVIISTGIQPEITCEHKIEGTKPAAGVKDNAIQKDTHTHIIPATKEFKKDILKALATSTPHKEFCAMNQQEVDAGKSDDISDPSISEAVATITNIEPVVNQTAKITESNDAPDVRIFVKRRRKVVKRPPMT